MLLFVLGVLLIAAAALLSGAGIEFTLRGQADGALVWGPSLFRALLAFHGVVLICLSRMARRVRPAGDTIPLDVGAGSASPSPSGNAAWIVLALLCLIALPLRLYRLDTCLWYDEVITFADFIRIPAGRIVTSFPNQNQHMMYSLMAHAAVCVFGENAAAARLPAVFFGVAGIVALFLFGRRLLSPRESLLACALMTVSYHHVWFSQNARGYTGLLFFTLLGSWFWLRARERGRAADWLGYILCAAGGLWIHMTMLFVLAAHGVVWLASLFRGESRSDSKSSNLAPLFAWLLGGTLTAQLYALSLPEFFRSAIHETGAQTEWLRPAYVLIESAQAVRRIGFTALAGALLGLLCAAAGWRSLYRRLPGAAFMMILPALFGGGAMLALGHALWPRFFFFCFGFALLVAVRGVGVFVETVCAKLFPSRDREGAVSPFAHAHTRIERSDSTSCDRGEGVRSVSGPAPLPHGRGSERESGSETPSTSHTPSETAIHAIRFRAEMAVASLLGVGVLASASMLPRCYALPKQDFIGARDFVERKCAAGDAVVAVGLAGAAYRKLYAPHWKFPRTPDELSRVRASHRNTWLVYTLDVELKGYHPELWAAVERTFEPVRVFPGTLGGGNVCVWRSRDAAAGADMMPR